MMGLINLRNALMAWKKSPLPPGARWVEYLESTGRQYIKTGVVPNSQTKWVLDAMFSAKDLSSYMAMGAIWANPTRRFVIGRESNDRVSVSYGTIDNNINIAGQGIRQTYVLDAPNFTWQVGSASGTFSSGTFDITGIGEIFLFARNRVGVVNANTRGFRVYQSSIYDSGILVRDFIPVRKGTVGYLYDRVSGKLFGNAGTGDFVLGPDKN